MDALRRNEPPIAIRKRCGIGPDEFYEGDIQCRKAKFGISIGMRLNLNDDFALRSPAEPSFPPIQEPPDPPENPDAPVREPDPTEPGEI
jgi:hypothetical protein